MRRVVIALAAVAAVTAGVVGVRGTDGQAGSSPAAGQAGVPDRELGLRKTDLGDDRVPRPFVFVEDTPGGNERLPRSYEGSPPLVPHSIEGLLPITREENACLLCHASGGTDPADPPQLPRSHLIDMRAAPDVVRDTVAGARWVCTSCHVPQTDAPPLVGNTFRQGGR